MMESAEKKPLERSAELPTWALIFVIYTLWSLLLYHLPGLPWWVACPAGAVLVAWYGNLQHELLHGHPTRFRPLNAVFGWAPLTLWMPYHIYSESHLEHHKADTLTDPTDDPESYYFMSKDWQALNPLVRFLMVANNTLAGRMLVGPAIVITRFFVSEILMILRMDFKHLHGWIIHIGLSTVFIYGIHHYLGIPWWYYVAGIAYPGLSLSLVRSFYEHRPSDIAEQRTAIVEAGPLWSLLFLNNNLHVVHHDFPSMPWFNIPRIYRENRAEVLEKNGGFLFNGYSDVFMRYFLKSKDTPVYPVFK
ncbi:MAG: fatty acid desaturase [Rhodospirillales bacterium]|jgi:fatty acid desaturase|nr:fatty acid desaturase [Rhodospirillales bacterium]